LPQTGSQVHMSPCLSHPSRVSSEMLSTSRLPEPSSAEPSSFCSHTCYGKATQHQGSSKNGDPGAKSRPQCQFEVVAGQRLLQLALQAERKQVTSTPMHKAAVCTNAASKGRLEVGANASKPSRPQDLC